MDHPSHIHVRPFQLAGADGIVDPAMRDVINVVRGSRCRIRMRFADFAGKTMYHCHILDHEDLGMMGFGKLRPNCLLGPTRALVFVCCLVGLLSKTRRAVMLSYSV